MSYFKTVVCGGTHWMPSLNIPYEIEKEIETYIKNPKQDLIDALNIYFYLIKTSMKQRYIHKRYRLGLDSPLTMPLLSVYDLTEQRFYF